MPVTFRIEHFEGPLDLLLQLIEQEKLDISNVSLAHVAEQFLLYVKDQSRLPLEEAADFLVIAARLMYMKSKLLFPDFSDEELEEGPDLETQLRRYQAFVEASKDIDAAWKAGARSFARSRSVYRQQEVSFVAPIGLTPPHLVEMFRRVIARLEPFTRLPTTSMERVVTIQEKIQTLLKRVKDFANTTFRTFVGKRAEKAEMVVSFLALLELVKQRFVHVSQDHVFDDILIEQHPDAPETQPFAESYV